MPGSIPDPADQIFIGAYKTTMIDRPEYTRVEKPNTRGKVLGGSSCLNYYTWIPGSAATFDEWADFGGEEWKWDGVREYLYKVSLPTIPDANLTPAERLIKTKT